MAGLYYIGKTPEYDRDLVTQATAKEIFNSGVDRSYVIDQITAKAATKLTKSQVDTWDLGYAPVNYYQQQDKLLMPNSAKGIAGGVATLSGTTITGSQLPVLGAGTMRGPYGISKQYSKASIGSTPSLVGEWLYSTDGTSFVMPVTGFLMAFATIAVQNTGGRTVLEVRAGTKKTYADQVLVATGYGRTWFDGYQIINVLPAAAGDPDTLSDTIVFDATVPIYVSMWMFNEGGGQSNLTMSDSTGDGSSSVTSGMIYSAALYVLRTDQ